MADSSLNSTDDGNPGYGYATRLLLGFSVIPIRSMDYDSLSGKYCKAPALPSGCLKPFFDTRADINQLYDWFVTQGHINMAICTGRVSGIVVASSVISVGKIIDCRSNGKVHCACCAYNG